MNALPNSSTLGAASGRICRTKTVKKLRVNAAEEAFLFWVKALNLPIPQRNWKFHQTRKFEIDFCWPKVRIGCEINGGIWVGGAHARPLNILRDMEKQNLLLDLHWRVWHYTPKEVIDGIAIQHLDKVLRELDTDLALLGEPVIPKGHSDAMAFKI